MNNIIAKYMVTALTFVVTTIIFSIIYAIAKRSMIKQLELLSVDSHNYHRKVTANKLLQSSFRYILFAVYLIVVLVVFGVSVTTIITSAGLFSIALGFGAKSLVEDCISGFFIYFEEQFNVGDTVEIDGFKGVVLSLGFKSTVLKNWLGDVLVIRNGKIETVINYSVENSVAVVELKVDRDTDMVYFENLVNNELNKKLNRDDLFIDDVVFSGVSGITQTSAVVIITANVYPMKNIEAERVIRRECLKLINKSDVKLASPRVEFVGDNHV